MSDKQELFCQEYIIDFNATQAAIRAGYSKKTANRIATENLSKPVIQACLNELKTKRAIKVDVTAERILKELANIAFLDIRKFFDEDGQLKKPADLDDECATTLSSIESDELFEGYGDERRSIGYSKKVKFWDKLKALEMLAKHTGFFEKDNQQKPVTAINLKTLSYEQLLKLSGADKG